MPRRGLTLLELVVVVFIIGVLAALALVAVQRSRESSRRATCQTRMANFGRALQSYESVRRQLPSTLQCKIASNGSTICPRMYSPHTQILAYLDQSALARSIDLRKDQLASWTPQLQPAMGNRLEVFLCPSDQTPLDDRPGNNFFVSMGTGPGHLTGSLPSAPGDDGAFTGVSPLSMASFRDGLGHTVAASEKLMGSWNASFSRQRDAWHSGLAGVLPEPISADATVNACDALSGTPSSFFSYGGTTWFISSFGNTWFNHALPPNAKTPDCSIEGWALSPPDDFPHRGAYAARSAHDGCVNCLFMDGSVRLVSNDIKLGVWRALGTRAGGEPISDADLP